MTRYETFKDIPEKKRETVREQIATLYQEGLGTAAIAKKVKLGTRSIATAIGNFTRKCKCKSKKNRR